MQDAEIPADFSFDTTAPLRIALEPGQSEGTPASEIYRGVEIARTNGHVIYRGPMPVDRPLVVNLGLPLADREVRLTLLSEVDQVERILPVIDGVVQAEIR